MSAAGRYLPNMETPLVSVIMAARNVGPFVGVAIQSVLEQTYKNWELWVVENDSSDATGVIISSYPDSRIHHLTTSVSGLCNARNMALDQCKGEFVCFLDADDRLPARSLEWRVAHFQLHPEVMFVDGIVVTFTSDFASIRRIWKPDFEGLPLHELGRINPRCFCAITWMIRRSPNYALQFDTNWSYLEDRVFFLSIASRGKYSYVNEEIYHIRRRPDSLMADHENMEKSFVQFLELVQARHLLSPKEWAKELCYFHRMFAKIYARQMKWRLAGQHFIRSFYVRM